MCCHSVYFTSGLWSAVRREVASGYGDWMVEVTPGVADVGKSCLLVMSPVVAEGVFVAPVVSSIWPPGGACRGSISDWSGR